MISEFAITEWSSVVPWKEKEQVEQDPEFLGDTEGLLRFGQTFDPQAAFELVKTTFIDRLPGRRD